MRTIVADTAGLDTEIEALNEEIQVVSELVNQCIIENASTAQSQEEYNNKYNRLVRRYDKAVEKLNLLTAERNSKIERAQEIQKFIDALRERPSVIDIWSDELWISFLNTATIYKEGKISFSFKNGTTIDIEIQ